MLQYPLFFKVSAKSPRGMGSAWTASSLLPDGKTGYEAQVAIPPEFAGPGGGFSPEDFYALALINCFIATFKVIAEKSNLVFDSLEANGSLKVDRDEKGMPWMKSFQLTVRILGSQDKERALRLLEKASQSCMILNSVRTEKTFQFEVE